MGSHVNEGTIASAGAHAAMLGFWQCLRSAIGVYAMELELERLPENELEEHAHRARSLIIEFDRIAAGIVSLFRSSDENLKTNYTQAVECGKIFKLQTFEKLSTLAHKAELAPGEARNAIEEVKKFCAEKSRYLDVKIADFQEKLVLDLLRALIVTMDGHKQLAVVSIDLMQYGRLIRNAHGAGGASVVFDNLNHDIATIINAAVNESAAADKVISKVDTGDGAVILFSCPDAAVKVAIAIHTVTKAHNEDLEYDEDEYQFHFRTGVATGKIKYVVKSLIDDSVSSSQIAGRPICAAVRLQAKAKAGQTLICDWTWGQLKDDSVKRKFKKQIKVAGKQHEQNGIPARPYEIYKPRIKAVRAPRKRSTKKVKRQKRS